MNHKLKLLIISLFSVVISITTVYAVTLIQASDVIYDNSKSGGSSNNIQGAIDELYGLSGNGGTGSSSTSNLINKNMISYITDLGKKDTTNLAHDGTIDDNLRYIGSDPNNYVEFNGELWRIIGVMNNVKDSSGTTASRVKIIRSESIGIFSYDNKPSGTGSSTSNYGSNSWKDSRLQIMLNSGPYWNRTTGNCPYDTYPVSNKTKACNFSNIGLSQEAKEMITNINWPLGGTASITNGLDSYTKERGTTVYSGRLTNWNGFVGLIYPSDSLLSINSESNKWLIKNTFTLTHRSDSELYEYVLFNNGGLGHQNAEAKHNVLPVVFLNTDLYITKGKGTEENPYKISFEIEVLKDSSNASPPKIDDEEKLKPVKLADDGTVTYVSQADEEWYNYDEKKWANAIILVDNPSTTYKVGDVIKEDDIESYFVWIPKYKYKLWNTGTASKTIHEIEIIFDTKDTTDKEGESCKTPMTSGSIGNCNNGEWMTHPAFISLGVDGFWVGKFETGYNGATSTAAAQVNSSDSNKIIIKPNVYSWRNNTIYNMFISSYNYERALDSHMMKNTEWGAVAYLSHSKYGLGYEVRINNNSSYKTGYSALPSTNQHVHKGDSGDGASYNQPYNTDIGYLASTTGNITGIYDMSGGVWEIVSAYISGKLGSSGFSTSTLSSYDDKYFDVYSASGTLKSYQYKILGDATSELGPFMTYLDGDGGNRWHSSWYGNYANHSDPNGTWYYRGGGYDNGGIAGTFYFGREDGATVSNKGFRLILVG